MCLNIGFHSPIAVWSFNGGLVEEKYLKFLNTFHYDRYQYEVKQTQYRFLKNDFYVDKKHKGELFKHSILEN